MIADKWCWCHMPAMIMLQLAPVTLSSSTQMTCPTPMRRLSRAILLYAVGAVLAIGSAISPAAASMIRDTEIEAGLEGLMAHLVAAAGFPPGGVKIRIVIDPSYNAFVAGKRIIYVHSGLLEKASGAGEFLGVMAHELGHVREGHVQRYDDELQQASNNAALATLAAIAVAAGGSGDAAAGVLIGGTDTAKRGFLASRRRDEAVADEIALDLLEKTGTSAVGLRDLMARMARQRSLPESRQSLYYSTHPGAQERLQALQDHVGKSDHSDNQLPEVAEEIYDRIVAKMAAWTEAPQRVIVRAAEMAPNAMMETYILAIASFRRGDLGGALAHMNQLTALYPDDAFFHEFKGDILFAMAKPAEAAASYETALQRRPGSVLIQLNLGRSLIAEGGPASLERAIQVLAMARNAESRWGFLHRQYGIALGKAGRITEADLALADEAIVINDKQRAAQLAKRVLAREGIAENLRSRASDILFRYGGQAD